MSLHILSPSHQDFPGRLLSTSGLSGLVSFALRKAGQCGENVQWACLQILP